MESAFGVEHGDISKGLPRAAKVALTSKPQPNFDPYRSGYKTDKQLAHLNGKDAAKTKATHYLGSGKDRMEVGTWGAKRAKETLRNHKPTGSFKKI